MASQVGKTHWGSCGVGRRTGVGGGGFSLSEGVTRVGVLLRE